MALKSNKDLKTIASLYEQHHLKCIIDGPYPLEDAPKLIQYFGEGRHKGKIIIKVNEA